MKAKVKRFTDRYIKRTIAVLLGHIFYDPKYLTGRSFGKEYINGWTWIMRDWFMQKVIGCNRHVPFPVDFRMKVGNWKNIEFDNDNLNIFQKVGNYYQATGARIIVGKNTWIANGVAIITANHDLVRLDDHGKAADVVLGEECWIGSNAVILPGVTLGPHTVVGAGAVVTKSFEEGWCVLGGVPAVRIKNIEHP